MGNIQKWTTVFACSDLAILLHGILPSKIIIFIQQLLFLPLSMRVIVERYGHSH